MRFLQPAIDQAAAAAAASQYAVDFNATTTIIDCGNDVSINQLHDAAFTCEAWVKKDGLGEGNYGKIIDKAPGGLGWSIYAGNAEGVIADIYCATTTGSARSGGAYFPADSVWRHVAVTWDDASYTTPRIWINGTERTIVVTNRSGAVVSDATSILVLGNNSISSRTLDGAIAWARLSNVVRYTAGFTPAAKDAPPAPDGNTVEQWNLNTGSGAVAVAQVSSPTNDGAIANGSWIAL